MAFDTPTGHTLLPHHEHTLRVESAISEEMIGARGYHTVTVQAELRRLGFGDRQLPVPTPLVPIWMTAVGPS
jgi:hypothetical protein